MDIQYKDATYKGTREDIIRELRTKERLSYRDIQDLVGCSYTHVGNILKRLGLNKPIVYPELKDPQTFDSQSDEQIASDLNIPVSRVASARKNLGLRKKNVVKVMNRQRSLSKYLFGHSPGPEFVNYIKTHLTQLAPRKAELIDRFYLQGSMEALSDNINSDTGRVYRSKARQDLKQLLTHQDAETLIQLGVLVNGKRNSFSKG